MDGVRRFKFRRTTLLICGLAAFLAGIALARTKIYIPIEWFWASIIPFMVTFKQKRWLALASIVLCGLALGWWRGSIFMTRLANYDELYKRPVIITAKADSDGIYSTNSQLAFDVTHVEVTDPLQTELVGKISVKGFGANAVYRGDMVQVEGKLYPTRGSRQASISFAQIKVLSRSGSPIESARRRFQTGMFSALPEPLASFGLGMLIGQRSTLPKATNDQMRAVGLSHIVAVSGYNLTIIMTSLALFLRKRSKYQGTVLSLVLIVLFLLFAGLSASIVRAAIVSVLGLWATYYGRRFRPVLLILLAAALTAGWYPIYIWADIGWYLSFFAFFGVLVIGPLIIKRLYGAKQPKLLTAVLIETASAQLMAFPLIMYIFGQVSIVALLANILIVPLVPIAMLLVFVAALAGMFMPIVAGWLAWPARILLTYMLDIISLLSRVPHALAQQGLPLPKMLGVYAIILGIVFILWSKTKGKNDMIEELETDITLPQPIGHAAKAGSWRSE